MKERKMEIEEIERQNEVDRETIESLKELIHEGTDIELLPMHPNLRRLLRWNQLNNQVD